MGLFSRIGRGLSGLLGGVDAETMRLGLPARAEVLRVVPQNTTVRIHDGVVERVCEFAVAVTVDDMEPYEARVRQRVPQIYLDGPWPVDLNVVAARVHPRDPRRIALDFDAPLPRVRAARDLRLSAA